MPTDTTSEARARLYEAAGVAPAHLSRDANAAVEWLAKQDGWTVDAVAQLLEVARDRSDDGKLLMFGPDVAIAEVSVRSTPMDTYVVAIESRGRKFALNGKFADVGGVLHDAVTKWNAQFVDDR